MLSYFGEQLAEQTSRGVRNEVTDVRLLQGDLAQAWAEGGREYATVAMRFQMIDATHDQAGRVVDGSPTEHVTATEVWTFVRVAGRALDPVGDPAGAVGRNTLQRGVGATGRDHGRASRQFGGTKSIIPAPAVDADAAAIARS